ncbi:MAG: hypothetical protein E5Y14_28230 [Mesorhizobium sp.]|nr:MAG: hypothetical protein E5Y14_28230 [Mesorhizobium sp.]
MSLPSRSFQRRSASAHVPAGVVFIPENGGGAGVRLKFNRREVKAIERLENEGGIVGARYCLRPQS